MFEASVPAVVATWEENSITRLLQDAKHGNADELSPVQATREIIH